MQQEASATDDSDVDLTQARREYDGLIGAAEAFRVTLLRLIPDFLEKANIEVADVSGRVKTWQSIKEKFERHPDYSGLASITDLIGVRIVCYYQQDVARATAVLRDEFNVEREEAHYARDRPDTFGYKSYHMNLTIDDERLASKEYAGHRGLSAELQVRTVLEDAWAVISHKLDYKSEAQVPSASRRTLFRVAALLETGDELFNQFRTEVGAARATYRDAADVGKEALATLLLDLDSLNFALQDLDLSTVQQVAVDAGFRPTTKTFEPSDSMTGRVLEAAVARGASNIDAVTSVVENIAEYKSLLEVFLKNAEETWGKRPTVNPYNVLAYVFSAGDERATEALQALGLKSELADAIRKVPRAPLDLN